MASFCSWLRAGNGPRLVSLYHGARLLHATAVHFAATCPAAAAATAEYATAAAAAAIAGTAVASAAAAAADPTTRLSREEPSTPSAHLTPLALTHSEVGTLLSDHALRTRPPKDSPASAGGFVVVAALAGAVESPLSSTPESRLTFNLQAVPLHASVEEEGSVKSDMNSSAATDAAAAAAVMWVPPLPNLQLLVVAESTVHRIQVRQGVGRLVNCCCDRQY